jgi:hypothetical protein
LTWANGLAAVLDLIAQRSVTSFVEERNVRGLVPAGVPGVGER